jgi:LacI family transcriptional regulator
VLAVAGEIGYRANRTASLMKLRRTRHLGVAMNPRIALHAELVEGIQAAADAAGYQIVLALVTDTHDEHRAVDTLEGFRCESVVLLGTDLTDQELRDLATRVPVVLLCQSTPVEDVDVVRSADLRGQRMLVDHLVGLGHRDIAYIDGGPHPVAVDRRRGYRAAMRRAGLEDEIVVAPGGQTEKDGRRVAERLLASGRLPTAICAFNDHVALGVVDTLVRHGIDVPGACSVTGYDDAAFAGLGLIELTTVDQRATNLAHAAVHAAISRLEGERHGSTRDRANTLLEPELKVRRTTAAPPASTRKHRQVSKVAQGAR